MTGKPRVGILVVAYNAASTLAGVLDRIPVEFRPEISRILVGDDYSSDATYLVGVGYRELTPDLPLEVIRHPRNLGYGGNQKAGYRWAIEHDLDIVVLLHGDGQYAPELLPDMVAPLARDEADAVFGSRMLVAGQARRGGMPAYKHLGNRILTRVENTLTGASLSEWHSGYRAYSVAALRDIDFDANDDGFNFDTQIIIQLLEAGKRITEIPIPTYYGDEICYVNGLGYARDVTRDVVRYRAQKMGFAGGTRPLVADTGYESKGSVDSSHRTLARWISRRRPGRLLDLGCADGPIVDELRADGHHITGVDVRPTARIKDRVDRFVEADLDRGLPPQLEGPFDTVVAADVLEHVRHPGELLDQLAGVLAPGGALFVSIPNFGHWYPRAKVALGRFDYDRRGILDGDHVRFFTRRSFERLLAAHGWRIRRRSSTGLPLEVVDRGIETDREPGRSPMQAVATVDRAARRVWPTMFAYQLLYELEPLPRQRG